MRIKEKVRLGWGGSHVSSCLFCKYLTMCVSDLWLIPHLHRHVTPYYIIDLKTNQVTWITCLGPTPIRTLIRSKMFFLLPSCHLFSLSLSLSHLQNYLSTHTQLAFFFCFSYFIIYGKIHFVKCRARPHSLSPNSQIEMALENACLH